MGNRPIGNTAKQVLVVGLVLFLGPPLVLAACLVLFPCEGLIEWRSDTAANDLNTVANALRLYEKQAHKQPASLEALVDAGVLEKMPRDPWGRDYLFTASDGGCELETLGRDGEPGGEGQDQDLRIVVECVR